MSIRLPMLALLALAPATPAAAVAVLGQNLQALAIFAGTDATTGAGALGFGSVMAGGVGTAGAGTIIHGDYTSAGAAVIGAGGATVTGSITAGNAVTTDDSAVVGGHVTAGAATTLGANSRVGGTVTAGAAITAGALAHIGGDAWAGAAATVGAGATVVGTVGAVAAITIGAGGSAGGQQTLGGSPVDGVALAAALGNAADSNRLQVEAAQTAFRLMATTGFLAPTMAVDTSLLPGVYTADSLSIAASVTLTLDGGGATDRFWVFNIGDNLTTGALSRIVLLNGASSDSIIWNTGGFTSLGANSTLLGTVLARSYISVGADTAAIGVGGTCGGLFSALSYVSAAANAIIGNAGCSGIDRGFEFGEGGAAEYNPPDIIAPVPEPAAWALWLAGFALTGTTLRRKRLRVVAA